MYCSSPEDPWLGTENRACIFSVNKVSHKNQDFTKWSRKIMGKLYEESSKDWEMCIEMSYNQVINT